MTSGQVDQRRWWRRILRGFSVVLGILGALFACAYPEIGRAPTGDHLDRLSKSPNYDAKAKRFVNRRQLAYDDARKGLTMGEFLKAAWFGKQMRSPDRKLPQSKVDLDAFLASDRLAYIWLGHSTILLRIDGKTILMDPNFHNAAPVPFLVNRFQPPVLKLEELPPIDLVLISHDHYDHLSRRAIQFFRDQKTKFIVPLGLSSYLEGWGVSSERVTELDWWQEVEWDGLKVVCTPSQHFSGRSGVNANPTLWASWTVLGSSQRFYFSGDSGYDQHFREIGKRFGPFDVAFMECGQYNPLWPMAHLFPNETVRAGQELRANAIQPIHWGTYQLSHHDWFEPPEFSRRFGEELGLRVLTPILGQLVDPKRSVTYERWWKDALPQASTP